MMMIAIESVTVNETVPYPTVLLYCEFDGFNAFSSKWEEGEEGMS